MKISTATLGSAAEEKALKHLLNRGYQLVSRNFRSRRGEIDLIVSKDKTLVFVEVRYRNDTYRGTPAETVTYSKIGKIIRTAQFFLLKNPAFQEHDCRFDVISISDTLEWMKCEFTLDDYA